MPYKKSYSRYGNAVARRTRVYGPAVGQLAKDVGYIMSLVNSEPHTWVISTANNVDYNGAVISLSAISQGDTVADRSGNSVLPRYFTCKLHINKKITSSTADHVSVRVLFFRYWGESSDAAPNVIPGDILATISSQYAPLSTLNDNNTGPRGDRDRRIEVMHSEFHTLDTVSKTSFDIDLNREFNGPSVKNKQHLKFRSPTTEDPVSGGVYACIISDNATATEISYTMYSKLTFYDN